MNLKTMILLPISIALAGGVASTAQAQAQRTEQRTQQQQQPQRQQQGQQAQTQQQPQANRNSNNNNVVRTRYGNWNRSWGAQPSAPPRHWTRTNDWYRHVRACQQRFRSYNARTDTYRSNSGRTVRCTL